jgi:hypothetical protein
MIDKKRIEEEAEHFFEWPTKDRTFVTRTSMLIFANVIAEMAREEEREACANVCEVGTTILQHNHVNDGKPWATRNDPNGYCTAAIRAQSKPVVSNHEDN